MAKQDVSKQEFQLAASVVGRVLAGMLWDRFHAFTLDGAAADRPQPPEIRTLNRKDAAKLLSVSVNTLDGLVRQGKLKPANVTGRRANRYPVDQLETLLRQRE